MTDTLLPGEVMNSLHAYDPTVVALHTPYDPQIVAQIRRFGFEYEMFPNDDDDDDWYSLDDRLEWAMEDYDPYDPDHCNCNCEQCLDSRREEYEDDTRRDLQRQGYSNDRPGRSDDVEGLVRTAYDHGLIADDYLHSYHCHCGTCSPTRGDVLLTAQEDCSVGVEFVSRILDLDDFDRTATEIGDWVRIMNKWKDDGNWMPDGHWGCGNHVHVEANLPGVDDDVRSRAFSHINALYAVFDWEAVADGGCGRVRRYNDKPSSHYSGNWLSDRGYGTFEHRLWNTPADPDRLWAHLGISIALNRWAFALARSTVHIFWTSTGYNRSMSDEVWNALTRNIDLVIAQVTAYIPDRAEFDLARQIIANLRPL